MEGPTGYTKLSIAVVAGGEGRFGFTCQRVTAARIYTVDLERFRRPHGLMVWGLVDNRIR